VPSQRALPQLPVALSIIHIALNAHIWIGFHEHIEDRLEYRRSKLAKMHGAHGLAVAMDHTFPV
jgi:hypothetical protein